MSAALVVAMFWQDAAAAAPDAGARPFAPVPVAALSPSAAAERVIGDPSLIAVPFGDGMVRQTHAGTNGKLLIHVQDAHANYSGQMSLAGMIRFFRERYGTKVVLVEGSSHDVSLDRLRAIADERTWKIAAKQMLRKGIISGEEYLNLTSDEPLRLRGIERKGLYERSLDYFAELTERRAAVLSDLRKARVALERLKVRAYPKALLDHEAALKDGPGIGEHAERVMALAARFPDTDTAAAPALSDFMAVRTSERAADFGRLNAEQEALLGALRTQGAPDEVEAFIRAAGEVKADPFAQANLFAGLMELARSRGIRVNEYPELTRHLDRLERVTRIDIEALEQEIELLEDGLYRRLLREPSARKLRAIERFIDLLERAYRIELTNRDFATLRANAPDFTTVGWQAFLNGELARIEAFDDLIPYRSRIDRAARFLKRFYRLVEARDRAFVANAAKVLADEDADTAFLVTGGYHTEHLTALLKHEGYSLAVFTPNVTDETDKSLYEKFLLAPRMARRRSETKVRLARTGPAVETSATTVRMAGLAESHAVAHARMNGTKNFYNISSARILDAISVSEPARMAEPEKPMPIGERTVVDTLNAWHLQRILPRTANLPVRPTFHEPMNAWELSVLDLLTGEPPAGAGSDASAAEANDRTRRAWHIARALAAMRPEALRLVVRATGLGPAAAAALLSGDPDRVTRLSARIRSAASAELRTLDDQTRIYESHVSPSRDGAAGADEFGDRHLAHFVIVTVMARGLDPSGRRPFTQEERNALLDHARDLPQEELWRLSNRGLMEWLTPLGQLRAALISQLTGIAEPEYDLLRRSSKDRPEPSREDREIASDLIESFLLYMLRNAQRSYFAGGLEARISKAHGSLLRSLEKFEPWRGISFSTYAYRGIDIGESILFREELAYRRGLRYLDDVPDGEAASYWHRSLVQPHDDPLIDGYEVPGGASALYAMLIEGLDPREIALIEMIIEGRTIRDATAAVGRSRSLLQRLMKKLAEKLIHLGTKLGFREIAVRYATGIIKGRRARDLGLPEVVKKRRASGGRAAKSRSDAAKKPGAAARMSVPAGAIRPVVFPMSDLSVHWPRMLEAVDHLRAQNGWGAAIHSSWGRSGDLSGDQAVTLWALRETSHQVALERTGPNELTVSKIRGDGAERSKEQWVIAPHRILVRTGNAGEWGQAQERTLWQESEARADNIGSKNGESGPRWRRWLKAQWAKVPWVRAEPASAPEEGFPLHSIELDPIQGIADLVLAPDVFEAIGGDAESNDPIRVAGSNLQTFDPTQSDASHLTITLIKDVLQELLQKAGADGGFKDVLGVIVSPVQSGYPELGVRYAIVSRSGFGAGRGRVRAALDAVPGVLGEMPDAEFVWEDTAKLAHAARRLFAPLRGQGLAMTDAERPLFELGRWSFVSMDHRSSPAWSHAMLLAALDLERTAHGFFEEKKVPEPGTFEDAVRASRERHTTVLTAEDTIGFKAARMSDARPARHSLLKLAVIFGLGFLIVFQLVRFRLDPRVHRFLTGGREEPTVIIDGTDVNAVRLDRELDLLSSSIPSYTFPLSDAPAMPREYRTDPSGRGLIEVGAADFTPTGIGFMLAPNDQPAVDLSNARMVLRTRFLGPLVKAVTVTMEIKSRVNGAAAWRKKHRLIRSTDDRMDLLSTQLPDGSSAREIVFLFEDVELRGDVSSDIGVVSGPVEVELMELKLRPARMALPADVEGVGVPVRGRPMGLVAKLLGVFVIFGLFGAVGEIANDLRKRQPSVIVLSIKEPVAGGRIVASYDPVRSPGVTRVRGVVEPDLDGITETSAFTIESRPGANEAFLSPANLWPSSRAVHVVGVLGARSVAVKDQYRIRDFVRPSDQGPFDVWTFTTDLPAGRPVRFEVAPDRGFAGGPADWRIAISERDAPATPNGKGLIEVSEPLSRSETLWRVFVWGVVGVLLAVQFVWSDLWRAVASAFGRMRGGLRRSVVSDRRAAVQLGKAIVHEVRLAVERGWIDPFGPDAREGWLLHLELDPNDRRRTRPWWGMRRRDQTFVMPVRMTPSHILDEPTHPDDFIVRVNFPETTRRSAAAVDAAEAAEPRTVFAHVGRQRWALKPGERTVPAQLRAVYRDREHLLRHLVRESIVLEDAVRSANVLAPGFESGRGGTGKASRMAGVDTAAKAVLSVARTMRTMEDRYRFLALRAARTKRSERAKALLALEAQYHTILNRAEAYRKTLKGSGKTAGILQKYLEAVRDFHPALAVRIHPEVRADLDVFDNALALFPRFEYLLYALLAAEPGEAADGTAGEGRKALRDAMYKVFHGSDPDYKKPAGEFEEQAYAAMIKDVRESGTLETVQGLLPSNAIVRHLREDPRASAYLGRKVGSDFSGLRWRDHARSLFKVAAVLSAVFAAFWFGAVSSSVSPAQEKASGKPAASAPAATRPSETTPPSSATPAAPGEGRSQSLEQILGTVADKTRQRSGTSADRKKASAGRKKALDELALRKAELNAEVERSRVVIERLEAQARELADKAESRRAQAEARIRPFKELIRLTDQNKPMSPAAKIPDPPVWHPTTAPTDKDAADADKKTDPNKADPAAPAIKVPATGKNAASFPVTHGGGNDGPGDWVGTITGYAGGERGHLVAAAYGVIHPLKGLSILSGPEEAAPWPLEGKGEPTGWVRTTVDGSGLSRVLLPPNAVITEVETGRAGERVRVLLDPVNRVWYLEGVQEGEVHIGIRPARTGELDPVQKVRLAADTPEDWESSLPESIRKLIDASKDSTDSEKVGVKNDILRMFYYTVNPKLGELSVLEPDFIKMAFKYKALKCDGFVMMDLILSYLLGLPAEALDCYLARNGDGTFYSGYKHVAALRRSSSGANEVWDPVALALEVSPLYDQENVTDEQWQTELEMLTARAAGEDARIDELNAETRVRGMLAAAKAQIAQKEAAVKAAEAAVRSDASAAYFGMTEAYAAMVESMGLDRINEVEALRRLDEILYSDFDALQTAPADEGASQDPAVLEDRKMQYMAWGHFLFKIADRLEDRFGARAREVKDALYKKLEEDIARRGWGTLWEPMPSPATVTLLGTDIANDLSYRWYGDQVVPLAPGVPLRIAVTAADERRTIIRSQTGYSGGGLDMEQRVVVLPGEGSEGAQRQEFQVMAVAKDGWAGEVYLDRHGMSRPRYLSQGVLVWDAPSGYSNQVSVSGDVDGLFGAAGPGAVSSVQLTAPAVIGAKPLAVVSQNMRTVKLAGPAAVAERVDTLERESVSEPYFAPDGKWLAVVSDAGHPEKRFVGPLAAEHNLNARLYRAVEFKSAPGGQWIVLTIDTTGQCRAYGSAASDHEAALPSKVTSIDSLKLSSKFGWIASVSEESGEAGQDHWLLSRYVIGTPAKAPQTYEQRPILRGQVSILPPLHLHPVWGWFWTVTGPGQRTFHILGSGVPEAVRAKKFDLMPGEDRPHISVLGDRTVDSSGKEPPRVIDGPPLPAGPSGENPVRYSSVRSTTNGADPDIALVTYPDGSSRIIGDRADTGGLSAKVFPHHEIEARVARDGKWLVWDKVAQTIQGPLADDLSIAGPAPAGTSSVDLFEAPDGYCQVQIHNNRTTGPALTEHRSVKKGDFLGLAAAQHRTGNARTDARIRPDRYDVRFALVEDLIRQESWKAASETLISVVNDLAKEVAAPYFKPKEALRILEKAADRLRDKEEFWAALDRSATPIDSSIPFLRHLYENPITRHLVLDLLLSHPDLLKLRQKQQSAEAGQPPVGPGESRLRGMLKTFSSEQERGELFRDWKMHMEKRHGIGPGAYLSPVDFEAKDRRRVDGLNDAFRSTVGRRIFIRQLGLAADLNLVFPLIPESMRIPLDQIAVDDLLVALKNETGGPSFDAALTERTVASRVHRWFRLSSPARWFRYGEESFDQSNWTRVNRWVDRVLGSDRKGRLGYPETWNNVIFEVWRNALWYLLLVGWLYAFVLRRWADARVARDRIIGQTGREAMEAVLDNNPWLTGDLADEAKKILWYFAWSDVAQWHKSPKEIAARRAKLDEFRAGLDIRQRIIWDAACLIAARNAFAEEPTRQAWYHLIPGVSLVAIPLERRFGWLRKRQMYNRAILNVVKLISANSPESVTDSTIRFFDSELRRVVLEHSTQETPTGTGSNAAPVPFDEIDAYVSSRLGRPVRIDPNALFESLRRNGARGRAREAGGEFDDLRPYQTGDPYNAIDQRPVLKGRDPLTRVSKIEIKKPLHLVIDLRGAGDPSFLDPFKEELAPSLKAVLFPKETRGEKGFTAGRIIFLMPDGSAPEFHRSRWTYPQLMDLVRERHEEAVSTAPAITALKQPSLPFWSHKYNDLWRWLNAPFLDRSQQALSGLRAHAGPGGSLRNGAVILIGGTTDEKERTAALLRGSGRIPVLHWENSQAVPVRMAVPAPAASRMAAASDPSDQSDQKYWQEYWGLFKNVFRDGAPKAVGDLILREAAQGIGPDARVLDLGTGGNFYAAKLIASADGGPAVVDALDVGLPSEWNALIPDGLRDRIRYRQGSFGATGFEEGTFDRVISSFGIEWASGLDRSIREIRRILKPDGKAALIIHMPGSPIMAGVNSSAFNAELAIRQINADQQLRMGAFGPEASAEKRGQALELRDSNKNFLTAHESLTRNLAAFRDPESIEAVFKKYGFDAHVEVVRENIGERAMPIAYGVVLTPARMADTGVLNEEMIERFLTWLEGPESILSEVAAGALAAAVDRPDVFEKLLSLIEPSETAPHEVRPAVVAAAIVALSSRVSDARVRDALIRLLDAPPDGFRDDFIRIAAVKALAPGFGVDPEVRQAFLRVLGSGSSEQLLVQEVIWQTARAVEDDAELRSILLRICREAENVETRIAAIRALGPQAMNHPSVLVGLVARMRPGSEEPMPVKGVVFTALLRHIDADQRIRKILVHAIRSGYLNWRTLGSAAESGTLMRDADLREAICDRFLKMERAGSSDPQLVFAIRAVAPLVRSDKEVRKVLIAIARGWTGSDERARAEAIAAVAPLAEGHKGVRRMLEDQLVPDKDPWLWFTVAAVESLAPIAHRYPGIRSAILGLIDFGIDTGSSSMITARRKELNRLCFLALSGSVDTDKRLRSKLKEWARRGSGVPSAISGAAIRALESRIVQDNELRDWVREWAEAPLTDADFDAVITANTVLAGHASTVPELRQYFLDCLDPAADVHQRVRMIAMEVFEPLIGSDPQVEEAFRALAPEKSEEANDMIELKAVQALVESGVMSPTDLSESQLTGLLTSPFHKDRVLWVRLMLHGTQNAQTAAWNESMRNAAPVRQHHDWLAFLHRPSHAAYARQVGEWERQDVRSSLQTDPEIPAVPSREPTDRMHPQPAVSDRARWLGRTLVLPDAEGPGGWMFKVARPNEKTEDLTAEADLYNETYPQWDPQARVVDRVIDDMPAADRPGFITPGKPVKVLVYHVEDLEPFTRYPLDWRVTDAEDLAQRLRMTAERLGRMAHAGLAYEGLTEIYHDVPTDRKYDLNSVPVGTIDDFLKTVQFSNARDGGIVADLHPDHIRRIDPRSVKASVLAQALRDQAFQLALIAGTLADRHGLGADGLARCLTAIGDGLAAAYGASGVDWKSAMPLRLDTAAEEMTFAFSHPQFTLAPDLGFDNGPLSAPSMVAFAEAVSLAVTRRRIEEAARMTVPETDVEGAARAFAQSYRAAKEKAPDRPFVLFVNGAPGSGKSAWIRKLRAAMPEGVRVRVMDEIYREITDDIETLQSLLDEAGSGIDLLIIEWVNWPPGGMDRADLVLRFEVKDPIRQRRIDNEPDDDPRIKKARSRISGRNILLHDNFKHLIGRVPAYQVINNDAMDGDALAAKVRQGLAQGGLSARMAQQSRPAASRIKAHFLEELFSFELIKGKLSKERRKIVSAEVSHLVELLMKNKKMTSAELIGMKRSLSSRVLPATRLHGLLHAPFSWRSVSVFWLPLVTAWIWTVNSNVLTGKLPHPWNMIVFTAMLVATGILLYYRIFATHPDHNGVVHRGSRKYFVGPLLQEREFVETVIHELVHRLQEDGRIRWDIPTASALGKLALHRRYGEKDEWFKIGLKLFRSHPDPERRWMSVVRRTGAKDDLRPKEWKRMFSGGFSEEVPEPAWSYEVGEILAGIAQAISNKTARPEDAETYLAYISNGMDPILAERKVLNARMAAPTEAKVTFSNVDATRLLSELLAEVLRAAPFDPRQPEFERLRTVLSADEKRILAGLNVVRKTAARKLALEGNARGYFDVVWSGTPDCGMCYRSARIMASALTDAGYDARVLNFQPGGEPYHAYVQLTLNSRAYVIDLAAGQFVPSHRGKIWMGGLKEYMQTVGPLLDEAFRSDLRARHEGRFAWFEKNHFPRIVRALSGPVRGPRMADTVVPAGPFADVDRFASVAAGPVIRVRYDVLAAVTGRPEVRALTIPSPSPSVEGSKEAFDRQIQAMMEKLDGAFPDFKVLPAEQREEVKRRLTTPGNILIRDVVFLGDRAELEQTVRRQWFNSLCASDPALLEELGWAYRYLIHHGLGVDLEHYYDLTAPERDSTFLSAATFWADWLDPSADLKILQVGARGMRLTPSADRTAADLAKLSDIIGRMDREIPERIARETRPILAQIPPPRMAAKADEPLVGVPVSRSARVFSLIAKALGNRAETRHLKRLDETWILEQLGRAIVRLTDDERLHGDSRYGGSTWLLADLVFQAGEGAKPELVGFAQTTNSLDIYDTPIGATVSPADMRELWTRMPEDNFLAQYIPYAKGGVSNDVADRSRREGKGRPGIFWKKRLAADSPLFSVGLSAQLDPEGHVWIELIPSDGKAPQRLALLRAAVPALEDLLELAGAKLETDVQGEKSGRFELRIREDAILRILDGMGYLRDDAATVNKILSEPWVSERTRQALWVRPAPAPLRPATSAASSASQPPRMSTIAPAVSFVERYDLGPRPFAGARLVRRKRGAGPSRMFAFSSVTAPAAHRHEGNADDALDAADSAIALGEAVRKIESGRVIAAVHASLVSESMRPELLEPLKKMEKTSGEGAFSARVMEEDEAFHLDADPGIRTVYLVSRTWFLKNGARLSEGLSVFPIDARDEDYFDPAGALAGAALIGAAVLRSRGPEITDEDLDDFFQSSTGRTILGRGDRAGAYAAARLMHRLKWDDPSSASTGVDTLARYAYFKPVSLQFALAATRMAVQSARMSA